MIDLAIQNTVGTTFAACCNSDVSDPNYVDIAIVAAINSETVSPGDNDFFATSLGGSRNSSEYRTWAINYGLYVLTGGTMVSADGYNVSTTEGYQNAMIDLAIGQAMPGYTLAMLGGRTSDTYKVVCLDLGFATLSPPFNTTVIGGRGSALYNTTLIDLAIQQVSSGTLTYASLGGPTNDEAYRDFMTDIALDTVASGT